MQSAEGEQCEVGQNAANDTAEQVNIAKLRIV